MHNVAIVYILQEVRLMTIEASEYHKKTSFIDIRNFLFITK